jgi:Signal transduction histidine kinase regulating C4-dicarboxylate transport system
MKRLIKFWLAVVVMIMFGLTGIVHISANQLTFSVEPVLPSNQVDSKAGYFNIKLTPGQSQDLVLKYTNNTKKPITVNGAISTAKTNTNGVVDYNAPKIKKDSTLVYDISKLVTLPKEVALAAGETKQITAHVTMPNNDFKGIIAGGLTFNDADQDKANQSGKSTGMSIKNIYSFQIGLLMRQSTETAFSDSQIESQGLKLNTVKSGQLNYRNVVYANLQNPLSIYVNQMVVDAQISKSGSSKVLYSTTKGDMQMAPNSNFNLPIALGSGVRMKPGNYHLRLKAYSLYDNNGQYKTNVISNKEQNFRYRWVFDKDFVITSEQAQKYNKSDVTIKKIDWLFWILLAVSVLLLLALLFLLWFLKRRRDDKEVEIEEDLRDLNNELTTIIRTVTTKEYKRLVKAGKSVRLVDKHI